MAPILSFSVCFVDVGSTSLTTPVDLSPVIPAASPHHHAQLIKHQQIIGDPTKQGEGE